MKVTLIVSASFQFSRARVTRIFSVSFQLNEGHANLFCIVPVLMGEGFLLARTPTECAQRALQRSARRIPLHNSELKYGVLIIKPPPLPYSFE